MELFDLHCHLDLLPSMLEFALEAKKECIGILAVTTTPKAYAKEIVSFRSLVNIRVALGLHPQLVSERYNELSLVERYIDEAEYVGEIGLDFNSKFYFSKEKQTDVYENIIRWCSSNVGKTISIHSVRSDKVVLDILDKYCCTEKNKCILHWFSGSAAQLRRAVEMGCYFSINRAMIKSPNGQKLLTTIPPENMLVETDAPFINEIHSIQQFKSELMDIEASLVSVFGNDIIQSIYKKSKELLSMT